MYGIFTYIWVIFGANVGKYSIHGAYGYHKPYSSVYFVAYHDSANIRATACGKVHILRRFHRGTVEKPLLYAGVSENKPLKKL